MTKEEKEVVVNELENIEDLLDEISNDDYILECNGIRNIINKIRFIIR